MDVQPIERDLTWLGSGRFWLVIAVAVVLVVAIVGIKSLQLQYRQAPPQEAFLYGQWNLTPGSPTAWRVFVRNAEAQTPVPGADVDLALVAASGETVWEAQTTTDDGGIATAEPTVAADLPEGDYTLAVHARSDHGRNDFTQPITVKREYRVLVTTDKPLYQPGQVIHIRILALATADLRPAAGREVTITVRDAKGNKVFSRRLTASEYGLAAADFALADQVVTGQYTVAATVAGATSERVVTVERYRLPKFRLDLATDQSYYAPGARVRGEVRARYTFGEPVAGARVRIVVSELVERFRPFAHFEATTDADGGFVFRVDLKHQFVGQPLKQGDAVVSFEATVTDPGGHTQTRTLERIVTTRPIRIDVVPESGALVPGVANVLYLVTSYPDGRPAPTTLEVEPLGLELATDAAGIATVTVEPDVETLALHLIATDQRGVRVLARPKLAAAGDPFLVRTDRAVYETGDTVALTVLAGPTPSGRVFVDAVKDRRTVLTRSLEVTSGRGQLALDLPDDLFGTLELHAWRLEPGGEVVSDTRIIQVRQRHELAIRAELDRADHLPGETAVLDFLVTRTGGEPVPAALSLAGVDEAVFALQEMRPGLERVYFALLAELLKPRYELHGHLPDLPDQVVAPGALASPEAAASAAVRFAAAAGRSRPEKAGDLTSTERQQELEKAKQEHLRQLQVAGLATPSGLWFLLLLPLLLYALVRLFWRRPVREVLPSRRLEVHRGWRAVVGWWFCGLYAPFVMAVAGAFVATREMQEELAAGLAGLTAAAMLVLLARAVRRVRRAEIAFAAPLLRKLAVLLPAAYLCGILAVIGLVAALSGLHPVLDEESAALILLAMLAVGAAAGGAVAVAGRAMIERLSGVGFCWLGLSRTVLVALPTLISVALLGVTYRAMPLAAAVGDGAVFPEAIPPRPAAFEAMDVAKRDAAGELKAPSRVRRHFPETLLWEPELITDVDGRARLEVPLADSITTWRIATSAVSAVGELGAETVGLRVFQDFFVDLDLPVALTQNDFVSLPVAVYNYLDRPQSVELELEPDAWFELRESSVRTLRIEPRTVTSVYFPLVALRPGQHALRITARGSEMADAVERRVRVEPDGEAFVETLNGTLEEGVELEFVVADDAIDGASDCVLKIYPGAFSQVMEGLEGILRMPFGCFEQTSSATYPNVLVLDYMRRQKQIRPEIEMQALEYVGLGYQRLLSFEVEGGGFEWFGKPPAHTVLTAYGLLEFADMGRVYEVDPAVLARTRDWLYAQQEKSGAWQPTTGGIAEGAINAFQGQELRTTAYVAWAMATAGETDSRLVEALDYVAKYVDEVDDPYTLALSAHALIDGQRSAKMVLDRLHAMRREEDKQTWWVSTSEGVTYSSGDTLAVETTALVAHAYLAERYRTATAHQALAWLIAQKDPHGTWRSTQATVAAMRALLAGTGPAGEVEGEVGVRVVVNGELARELTVTPETADVYHLLSLREHLRKGRNQVALEVAGSGNLAYQLVATHYRPWPEAEPPEPQKELEIEVDYDTVQLATEDLVTCRVTLRYHRPGAAMMTLVDLGIPPGFELLTDDFEDLLAEGAIDRYSVAGQQVILYFQRIPSGEPVVFTYRLRARYPLRVSAPGAAVYPYYEPSLRDQSEPVVLTVQ